MSNRYEDLVLHLKLDDIDIAANAVPDSSPSQRRATVNGVDLVADDTFGACLNFNEPDDLVEVSDIAVTGVNPAHTIEAWIKLEAYPQARSWILLLGQEGAGAHHWLLNADLPGAALSRKTQLGAWGDSAKQATPEIPLGQWVHLATAYDGQELVSYINGSPTETKTLATFNCTNKRLTLGKRGLAAEKNFRGKIANVRIYKRALSMAEIREDMDADKLALPAFRKAHPIAFSLSDENENFVLYISDDPKDENRLNLELRNTSGEAITLEKRGKEASQATHHFELVFRSGVLSDKTLKRLYEKKAEIIPENGPWDIFSPGEDSRSGTVSLYLLYKETNQDTTGQFVPGQRLTVPLRNFTAQAGAGERGTRVELKLNRLTYVEEKTPITGSRIQHLQIISHLGSRRVPLHVGFVGSNRILNDGSSANTLVLQLMNVLKSEQDTSVTLTRDSTFLISFDVQSDDEVAPWSLCTAGEIEELKANDIIVAQKDKNGDVVVDAKGNPVSDAGRWEVATPDHRLGESPIWRISPRQDIILQRDDYIQIQISNIKTSLPSGLTNLYLEYKNIPGFWHGQVVCTIEKAPLLFCDAKDQQGKYKGELRVGIGTVNPLAKLEIAMAPKDADTRPLVIRKESAHYLTVLPNGKVGIGKAEPEASLDVNGEIRANLFKAGEGFSRRLPVGKQPVGTGTPSGTVWDEDIYWYRIAKIAASKPLTPVAAEFSLRAMVAGQTYQTLTFRIVGFSGLSRLTKRPVARFTILSNTGSLVFAKVRVVVPTRAEAASEGYLEIFTRQSFEGETDVSFSIYDNLDTPAWRPMAWEKQPSEDPNSFATCEYSLDRLFVVADAAERLSVDPRGDLLINGKVGLGTTTPAAKLSIMGGLHVGGESDPGDKNLLVGGNASITGGLQVGREMADDDRALFTSVAYSKSLFVNGEGFFLGTLHVRDYLGLLHRETKTLPALIAVEPALVFKTQRDGKWHNSITIQPPGGDAPALDVAGHISERLDVIQCNGREDWGVGNHPIKKYFSQRLRGKPVGTMLRVITDLPVWRGHYWQGWVDADGKIRVINNYHNTHEIAPDPPSTGPEPVVVYAD